jgi:hypothetical protein
MKSQGSAPEAHKTLQSQNYPTAGNRLSVNDLNVVHGRRNNSWFDADQLLEKPKLLEKPIIVSAHITRKDSELGKFRSDEI